MTASAADESPLAHEPEDAEPAAGQDAEHALPAQLFADLVATQLPLPNVSVGRALSREGLMVHGKLYAFLATGDLLVVKLPNERVRALVSSGEAEPMTMGKRTMREWAAVPYAAGAACEGRWQAVADEARTFVAGLVTG